LTLPSPWLLAWLTFDLKNEAVLSSETPENFYQTLRYHVPEDFIIVTAIILQFNLLALPYKLSKNV
jgi:hypothetical protein